MERLDDVKFRFWLAVLAVIQFCSIFLDAFFPPMVCICVARRSLARRSWSCASDEVLVPLAWGAWRIARRRNVPGTLSVWSERPRLTQRTLADIVDIPAFCNHCHHLRVCRNLLQVAKRHICVSARQPGHVCEFPLHFAPVLNLFCLLVPYAASDTFVRGSFVVGCLW
jgi:hypothetical protein